jgi:hypothetical protein
MRPRHRDGREDGRQRTAGAACDGQASASRPLKGSTALPKGRAHRRPRAAAYPLIGRGPARTSCVTARAC